jgi:hypothetical protein
MRLIRGFDAYSSQKFENICFEIQINARNIKFQSILNFIILCWLYFYDPSSFTHLLHPSCPTNYVLDTNINKQRKKDVPLVSPKILAPK